MFPKALFEFSFKTGSVTSSSLSGSFVAKISSSVSDNTVQQSFYFREILLPIDFCRQFAVGQVPVHWVVHFDPRGEHTLRYRCKNVNLVEKTVKGVEDEQEYLFVP
jgi:hypothetical protein